MLDETPTKHDLYAQSRDALDVSLRDARRAALAPSPRLTLSQWAEQHGRLSSESSAEPGRFSPFGFQRGMLDAMSDPSSSVVVVKKSARVGYTQCATMALAYYLDHDPTSALFVLPTEDDARDFAKGSLNPMLRDTPCLSSIAGSSSAADEWHTRYTARGSVLRMRGAYSADTFRRITSRINIGDEIDAGGWDNGANSQGDKIRLLRKRGETYWNNKLILGSTPTTAGASRILQWFLRGDQRRYFVPCPHCDELQVLEWGGRDTTHGVKWPTGKPDEAYYVCKNGCVIEESSKSWMDAHGEWRATAEGEPGFASYHVNTLYSLFPNARWGVLAGEFVEAKTDTEKLRSFVNLVLGEEWEEKAVESAAPHILAQRAEVYAHAVPREGLVLTAGVDTQSADGGRFEASIYGWGPDERSWLVGHWILDAHPLTDPRAWTALEALLSRSFSGPDGRDYRVQAAAIDSGGDYRQEVYSFAAKHAAKRWWAIKGFSRGKGLRGKNIWPTTPTAKSGRLLHTIEVDIAKDVLGRRIGLEPGAAGSITWPAGNSMLSGSAPIDGLFFERLMREKKRPAPGRPGSFYWTTPSDQEPWDCLVYAYAATYGLRQLAPWAVGRLGAPPVLQSNDDSQAPDGDGEAENDAKPAPPRWGAIKADGPAKITIPRPAGRLIVKTISTR